jgi:hypothetical protein
MGQSTFGARRVIEGHGAQLGAIEFAHKRQEERISEIANR